MPNWSRANKENRMSWFDEQIKQRKESDDSVFSEANRKLGDVVSSYHRKEYGNTGSAEDDIGRILNTSASRPRSFPAMSMTSMTRWSSCFARPES